jgi:hypothetical protein
MINLSIITENNSAADLFQLHLTNSLFFTTDWSSCRLRELFGISFLLEETENLKTPLY